MGILWNKTPAYLLRDLLQKTFTEKHTVMKDKKTAKSPRAVAATVDRAGSTAPFPIYPDIDRRVPPARAGRPSEAELEQDVDRLNPDPDSLDRG